MEGNLYVCVGIAGYNFTQEVHNEPLVSNKPIAVIISTLDQYNFVSKIVKLYDFRGRLYRLFVPLFV